MAGVDEALVRGRAAVRLVHGRPQHAVVAPAVRAVEGVDRHQLDEADADSTQVVEPLDRGVERALGRECADVQLVDRRRRRAAGRARPRRSSRTPPGRRSASAVDPVGLPARARVGDRGPGVVDEVAVVDLARRGPGRTGRHQSPWPRVISTTWSPTESRSRSGTAPTRRTGRGVRGCSGSATSSAAGRRSAGGDRHGTVAGDDPTGQQRRASGRRAAPAWCRPSRRARPARRAAGSPR